MRKPDPRQFSLFDEPVEPRPSTPVVRPSKPLNAPLRAILDPGSLSYAEMLTEQIRRDIQVLREDEIYYDSPGRKFYEDRIADYRKELLRHQAEGPATPGA